MWTKAKGTVPGDNTYIYYSFVAASRATATRAAHSRKIRDLVNFMKEIRASRVTEEVLLAFLIECHFQRRPFGYLTQVRSGFLKKGVNIT